MSASSLTRWGNKREALDWLCRCGEETKDPIPMVRVLVSRVILSGAKNPDSSSSPSFDMLRTNGAPQNDKLVLG
jgi:hypothetical protein